jgi:hypothetical protein
VTLDDNKLRLELGVKWDNGMNYDDAVWSQVKIKDLDGVVATLLPLVQIFAPHHCFK